VDKLEKHRNIVKQIINEYAKLKPAYGEIQVETVFDEEQNRYIMTNVGWEDGKRVYGNIIHVDIIDGKVWIQYDGTEDGIAGELEEAGVPANDIVLGFRPPEIRQHTGYAVA